MVTDLLEADVRHLAVVATYDRPRVVRSYKQKVRYSIVPKRYRKVLTRDAEIVVNSEGVGVFLHLGNNQHRLFHKDISACETKLLRLAQKQLAYLQMTDCYKWIRGPIVDALSALVSQDKERANKERERIRGLGPQLESVGDTEPGLDLCILPMVGSTS